MTDELGPFQPGTGRLPPYLAGREREQAILRGFAGRLRRRRPAPSEIVLCGPRGNGKTVLLRWLRMEVGALNASSDGCDVEVETLWLTPPKAPTIAMLIARIARDSWLKACLRRLGVQVGVPGVGSTRLDAPGVGAAALEEALADRVGRNPLIVLFDEAHHLDLEVGQALLRASQAVGGKLPFLLVLAGTPDLEDRLDAMGVSFWDRARQMRLGRLSEDAAGEAIRRPLARDGISIADGFLAEAYRDHNGYPFFVQHWGEELWQRARSRRRVTAEDLAAARRAVELVRRRYYRKRQREMRRLGLLAVARAVADAFEAVGGGEERGFQARPAIGDEELDTAIRRGLGARFNAEQAAYAESKLRHLGYVWPTRSASAWEPGIPSLMAYMRSVNPPDAGRSATGKSA